MDEFTKALISAQGYLDDVFRFDYNDEFNEVLTSTGKNRYNQIQKALINTSDIEPEKMVFDYYDEKTLHEIVLNIMSEILGEEYLPQIKKFQALTKNYQSFHPFDSNIGYTYNYNFTSAKINEFLIANLGTSASAVSCSHEYIHGILLPKAGYGFNDYFGNVHYKEFPSILTEKIFASKLNNLTNDNVAHKVKLIRQESCASHVYNTILYTQHLQRYPTQKMQIISAFIENEAYGYIICDVYATFLFKLYLEDPIHFLKLYQKLIKGEINLKTYFESYGLGLNEKVVSHYVKGLHK